MMYIAMKNLKFLSPLLFLFPLLFPAAALAGGDIFKCKIKDLRPTQLAVGMEEVREKENKFQKMSSNDLEKYEQENPEPVVLGPGGDMFIIDHHHLARALFEIGEEKTFCATVADYTRLSAEAFWKKMDAQKWVYTYDEYGNGPRPYSELPNTVRGLRDDPYRSLAGAVRKAGGYDKTDKPFAEFQWADFFRGRFDRRDVEKDFDKCVKKAVKIAHSPEASALPGFQR